MKLNVRRTSLSVTLLVPLLLTFSSFSQKPPVRSDDDVLEPVTATTDHKRVMLVFGGNWCYDCHVLDRALHESAAGQLMKESFVLVHVDIGEGDKNLNLLKKYKIPLGKGVPAVAILGDDGSLLYS